MEATKKELKEAFALWRKTGKKGNHYFTSKTLVGFYVSEKSNPLEPDLRIYNLDHEGKAGSEYCALWCNESKNGNQYLSGKIGDIEVVGFISKEDTTDTKKPYIKVYFREEAEVKTEAKGEPVKEAKKEKIPGKKF